MCSGKTTLGKYLAKRMNLRFIDVDEYIEEKENLTIVQIFEERGENIFRQLEHDYLKEISLLDNIIVATGGGTSCFNDNMSLMNNTGISVYIKTSIDVLVDRLLVMGENRPLVRGKSREELNRFVIPHFAAREIFYLSSSIMVNGDSWDEVRIGSEIIRQIKPSR
jgi:shikimate kinase